MIFKRIICNENRRKLQGFLTLDLSDREIEEVRKHLEKCQYCRMELDIFVKQNDLLMEFENIEPSSDFKTKLNEKIGNWEKLKQTNQEIFKKTHIKWFLPVPAVGVLAFIAILIFSLFIPFAYGIPLETRHEARNFVIGAFNNLQQKSILTPINLINYCSKCCKILCKCYQLKMHKGCICGGCEDGHKN